MALKRFTIGLPEDTYQILKEQAERDHRTLGQQIAYLLEVYVPAYQKTMEVTFPGTFIKPTLAENPTLTSDTTAYYKKRKELI